MNPGRKFIIFLGILFIVYSIYFMFFFRGGKIHEFNDLFTSKEFVVLLIGSLFCSTVFFKREY